MALERGHVAGAQDVLLSEDGGSHQNDLGHRVKHGGGGCLERDTNHFSQAAVARGQRGTLEFRK